jgi:hypothetical protein
MSKKEVCLASSGVGNDYVCLVNHFTSKDKKEVYAQCPARENFGRCIESFENQKSFSLVSESNLEDKH